MSGGYIKSQGGSEHQVVIFTFAGRLAQEKVNAWNAAVYDLKVRFGVNVMGVTLKGERTPPKMRRTKKRK